MNMHSTSSHKGPTGFGNILNGPISPTNHIHSAVKAQEDQRDSAYFSSTDASNTSAASFGAGSILSPISSTYHHGAYDKTPSPVIVTCPPQTLVSPSASSMSVASIMSPITPGNSDLRRFESNTTPVPDGNAGGGDLSRLTSRRESVDSRMNQRFDDMKLGNSPYATNNGSTTSFQQHLAAQRNPRSGIDNLSVHRISNGYQPNTERNPDPLSKTVKTAPAITGPATGTIARAAEPTKGQAWAFPEEDIDRVTSLPSRQESRRSSIAESIASSHLTTESRLPPGQRRLEDGHDFSRLSTTSSEFPPAHHHHTLQNKHLSDLQLDEAGQFSNQPYSRTPELRVSHKLAERKRRTEMKELFDQLRDLMPQERGSKASKYEILTKAINEHQRQQNNVQTLQNYYNSALGQIERLQREVEGLKMENTQLRTEFHSPTSASSGNQHQHPHPPPPHAAAAPNYAHDSYVHTPRTEQLPPLRSIGSSISNSEDSMTGVQYDTPRVNGYHS